MHFFIMLLGFRWEDVLEESLKIAVASIKAQQFIYCILLVVQISIRGSLDKRDRIENYVQSNNINKLPSPCIADLWPIYSHCTSALYSYYSQWHRVWWMLFQEPPQGHLDHKKNNNQHFNMNSFFLFFFLNGPNSSITNSLTIIVSLSLCLSRLHEMY